MGKADLQSEASKAKHTKIKLFRYFTRKPPPPPQPPTSHRQCQLHRASVAFWHLPPNCQNCHAVEGALLKATLQPTKYLHTHLHQQQANPSKRRWWGMGKKRKYWCCIQRCFLLLLFWGGGGGGGTYRTHSDHRFPAPSSKLCQIWLRHWRGTLYLRAVVQRRGQRPPKGSGTNMTIEAT